MSYFLVMTSSAQVKGLARKFGKYRNVAVVEVQSGFDRPKMISERARGMLRIVRHYGSCSVGSTERCQYAVAMKEAEELCARLNAEKLIDLGVAAAYRGIASSEEGAAT